MQNFQALGASRPYPQSSPPPLWISGYATVCSVVRLFPNPKYNTMAICVKLKSILSRKQFAIYLFFAGTISRGIPSFYFCHLVVKILHTCSFFKFSIFIYLFINLQFFWKGRGAAPRWNIPSFWTHSNQAPYFFEIKREPFKAAVFCSIPARDVLIVDPFNFMQIKWEALKLSGCNQKYIHFFYL